MKKYLSVLLVCAFVFAFAALTVGCKQQDQPAATDTSSSASETPATVSDLPADGSDNLIGWDEVVPGTDTATPAE